MAKFRIIGGVSGFGYESLWRGGKWRWTTWKANSQGQTRDKLKAARKQHKISLSLFHGERRHINPRGHSTFAPLRNSSLSSFPQREKTLTFLDALLDARSLTLGQTCKKGFFSQMESRNFKGDLGRNLMQDTTRARSEKKFPDQTITYHLLYKACEPMLTLNQAHFCCFSALRSCFLKLDKSAVLTPIHKTCDGLLMLICLVGFRV